MSKWLEKQLLREQQEASQASETVVVEPEPELPVSQFKPNDYKPGDTYTWQDGDKIWDVARMMNVDLNFFMEFNGIENPNELEPGIVVHFPVASGPKTKSIRYEVLPEAMPMHVNKPGGCKKWTFGNMKTWDDAESSGFYPEHSNLFIVAIAHVPIEDKDNPDAEAAYYMDGLALGDYKETGRVRWNVGYMWIDLAKGHIDRHARAPDVAEQAIKKQQAELSFEIVPPANHDEDGFDKNFVEQTLKEDPNKFKQSYQVLDSPELCIAIFPKGVGELDEATGKLYIWIKDYETLRPDRRLFDHYEIYVGGTFEFDGRLFARPAVMQDDELVVTPFWFGIPLEVLQSQAEYFMYNKKVNAGIRAEYGNTLTLSEKYLWVPMAKFMTRYMPEYISKIKKTNKTNNKKGKE